MAGLTLALCDGSFLAQIAKSELGASLRNLDENPAHFSRLGGRASRLTDYPFYLSRARL
ncbi:MAG: hypothetical protein LBT86_00695 [Deltaproteobacteria bacterium]|nr:hypothetical protein [Deltaproteobacteria bacterium]